MTLHRLIGAVSSSAKQSRRREGSGTPPSFISAPAINGQPVVGVAVTFTSGTVAGIPAPTTTQQWLLDGANIAGATNLTYTPQAGDVGANRLSVRQTATNANGAANSTSATKTVASVPAATAAPVILGTPTVGTPVAYTAGTYTGSPAPALTRQWLLDGNPITGATGSTYTPVAGDVGSNRLSVRETATNVAGSVNSTSSTVSVAASGGGPAVGDFYVDGSVANDSGDGSSANPKKFIASGMALLPTAGGKTLVIRPGTYSGAQNDIATNAGAGASGAWNVIKAEFDDTVVITSQLGLTENANHYMQFEGLLWDSANAKGASGHYFKFLRCGFRGGPPIDNNIKFGIGTNNFTPGATFGLMEDCFFYGSGGRYSVLIYNSDKIILRRCVVRHQTGWSDTKGDPQAGIAVYNSVDCETQNCIVVDIPSGLLHFEAGYYHPSNSRASQNVIDRGFIGVGIGGAAMGWDDGATNPNMQVFDMLAASCAVPAFVNGGNKTVTITRATAKGHAGGNFRNYSSQGGTLTLTKAVGWNMTNGSNIGGVTHSNCNFFNEAVSGEPSLDPEANGILYGVRRETSSTLDGLDKGAVILKKIGVSGTLWGETGYNQTTTDNLWPWPNEARIKSRLAADSAYGLCAAGALQLDGVTPKTLTSYVWEACGHQMPAGIYP